MYAARLGCYLAGGTPPGANRGYPGGRDPRPPRRARGFPLPGGIYFATHSEVWGGGRAFYDWRLAGTAAARGYLITARQFSDLVAQEMYREPGVDIDLRPVLALGHHELGPGRYETLLHVGELDGYPVLTFTAPWGAEDVEWTAPSGPYLRMLRDGLRESYGWEVPCAARYLAGLPGARGQWTAEKISAL
jgi:hypothetical protein